MEKIKYQVAMAIPDSNEQKSEVLEEVQFLINENKRFENILQTSTGISEEAIKLYNTNYHNIGDCQDLENMIKTIVKEFKKSGTTKTIKYLPWAVVERIFRLQGGTIEVVNWKYSVDFEGQGYDAETGEIEKTTKQALFVHLRAKWKGQILEEFYPIFDNQTSKVVRTPDSQQLNTSRQRGSVRLIARISGIGLWLFEQQDDQFEDDDKEIAPITKDDKEPVVPTTSATTSKKEDKKAEKEKKKVAKEEQKNDAMIEALEGHVEPVKEDPNIANMLLGNIIKGEAPKVEEPKQEPQVPPTPAVQTTFDNGSEEHSNLLLEVKKYVKTHKDLILAFRNEKGKELLSDLDYEELQEILERIKL